MNLAGLDKRIVFQRHSVRVDSIGNHINDWANFFSCWAGIKNSGRSSAEMQDASRTSYKQKLDFTVRACPKIADITPTEYRIFFNGQVYNIEAVDNTGKNSMKFTATLET